MARCRIFARVSMQSWTLRGVVARVRQNSMPMIRSIKVDDVLKNFIIAIAIYPVVLLGFWGLNALGALAVDWHIPADSMPLIYGLTFAALTVTLLSILGVATVVLALVSIANLIEYAQLFVPGRSPSAVDFVAGFAGIIVAATLVSMARSLVRRSGRDTPPQDPV